ncbi:hypothetical protein, partial [Pseudomonas aeruginosa]|uniref:hypothetical protein n=1 Tax=Pseudomonas aeruginosa TaxID=287 RepID=UPI0026EE2491
LQSLRQQAHLIGRPPLNLLFQQNRPFSAGRLFGVTGQVGCKQWSTWMQLTGQVRCNFAVTDESSVSIEVDLAIGDASEVPDANTHKMHFDPPCLAVDNLMTLVPC